MALPGSRALQVARNLLSLVSNPVDKPDKNFCGPGGAAHSTKFLGKPAVVVSVKLNF